jgi:hypothetical protein
VKAVSCVLGGPMPPLSAFRDADDAAVLAEQARVRFGQISLKGKGDAEGTCGHEFEDCLEDNDDDAFTVYEKLISGCHTCSRRIERAYSCDICNCCFCSSCRCLPFYLSHYPHPLISLNDSLLGHRQQVVYSYNFYMSLDSMHRRFSGSSRTAQIARHKSARCVPRKETVAGL